MAEQRYFVQIENPSETRRAVLETSRSVILSLQKFENYKDIRAEKKKEMDKLKLVIVEIADIMSRLRKVLPTPPASYKQQAKKAHAEKDKHSHPHMVNEKFPEVRISKRVETNFEEKKAEEIHEEAPVVEERPVPKAQPKPVPKTPSELEELNDALREIESKISRLG